MKIHGIFSRMGTEKPESKYKKGDKVLCYEPDPVKQPIIYNSVVMVRLYHVTLHHICVFYILFWNS